MKQVPFWEMILSQLVKKFPVSFMKFQYLLQCSDPTTGLCSEPDVSSTHPHATSHVNIILPCMPICLKWCLVFKHSKFFAGFSAGRSTELFSTVLKPRNWKDSTLSQISALAYSATTFSSFRLMLLLFFLFFSSP
jgi:hypothetical protein